MYKIESGIKLPTSAGGGKPLTFPLDRMQPGDSFELPTESELVRAYAAARAYGPRHGGMRFARRTMPDGKFRLFRIE